MRVRIRFIEGLWFAIGLGWIWVSDGLYNGLL